MSRDLTAKQQAFVEAYLRNGHNGAAAYREAYSSRASPQRAAEEAAKLLRHPKIAQRLVQIEQQAIERTVLTRERVINGLLKETENQEASASARVAAWGKLAEIGGYNAPKEVRLGRISDWTADDLRAAIAECDALGLEEVEGGLLPSPESEGGDSEVEGGERGQPPGFRPLRLARARA